MLIRSALLLLAAAWPLAATAVIAGRVVDDNGVPVAGAAVTLRSEEGGEVAARSDAGGLFELETLRPGTYRISVRREGFFVVEAEPIEIAAGNNETSITLERVREVRESIDVTAVSLAINLDQTAASQAIKDRDVVNVPYPSTHDLKNALRLMPGAVAQDSGGNIHFNGGAANQTLWTLDGFNLTDPATGTLNAPLNVEAAESYELTSSRPNAEYGRGSAGALAVRTKMGGDRFRFGGTNFLPGVNTEKGVSLGDWRPRFEFSGPIRRRKAWFFHGININRSKEIIQELPPGADRSRSVEASNYLRTQVNLTPNNILWAGALVSFRNARRNGIGPLDPLETTNDERGRRYFFNLKDQFHFRSGLVLDVGYARYRAFDREIPQGEGFLIFTPYGRRGHDFVDGRLWSGRHEAVGNALLPAFRFAGEHRIKLGASVNLNAYRQDIDRTGFERRRLDGDLVRRVVFVGEGEIGLHNREYGVYLQDSWRLARNLTADIGLRHDWDRLLRASAWSPRVAFAWSPPGLDAAKLSGGFAILRDATRLLAFAQARDQISLTTRFFPGGDSVGPLLRDFVLDQGRYRFPKYRNWSLGWEQRFPWGVFGKAEYQRRRGGDGLTYAPLRGSAAASALRPEDFGAAGFEGVFALRNLRRDRFDAVTLTLRKTFWREASWMASYTRSRGVSNAALDLSIDTPVTAMDQFGRLPWDAPNRLVSWSYVPVSKKWAVAYMAEWRSGYPFSIEDEEGGILGEVNAQRLPDFFELNLSVERKVRLLGYRWAFRMTALNALDRRNPTVVNNVLGSDRFLTYSGGTPRAYVARVRWLGKLRP